MIKIYAILHSLNPKHVFRLAHATRPHVENVFFVVEQDGIRGFGEAAPSAFYGEDANDILMRLTELNDYFRQQTVQSREDIARIWSEIWPMVMPSRATQCAVDIALWDLWGKLRGKSLCRLIWGESPKPFITSCTLGLSVPEELSQKIEELKGLPIVKVKMDESINLEPLIALAEKTQARLRLDANCAWSKADWPSLWLRLSALKVELIEQPLPPAQDALMKPLLAKTPIPFFADESCASEADIDKLPGHFSGFVLKLVKCGGITPALSMLHKAQKLNLKVMIGCMLESSVLIAAGSVLAQKADMADLDGSWLLKDDPFTGLQFNQGLITPSDAPGLGVRPLPQYTQI